MTSSHSHGYPHEHELEPQRGLPEALPAQERILWQGSPNWASLARHAFHVRKLVVYFAVIIALRMATILAEGGSLAKMMASALWLSLLAAVAIGILAGVALLVARTTIYTITTRRVVMRIGIVLRVTFNLPFKRIASADLRKLSGHTGDIPLALMPQDQIAYLHLWPHARPWRFAKTEPMLRSVANPEQVAATLTQAWSDCVGQQAVVQAAGASMADLRPPSPPPAGLDHGRPADMRTA